MSSAEKARKHATQVGQLLLYSDQSWLKLARTRIKAWVDQGANVLYSKLSAGFKADHNLLNEHLIGTGHVQKGAAYAKAVGIKPSTFTATHKS
jgi:hypothetical protein